MVVDEQCEARRRDTGRRLREWRIRRDKSQAEVARVAGITQASLSNYETGKRELPLATALNVAAALDVSLGELLDVPDVIVLRDSKLGQAVSHLCDHPELLENVVKDCQTSGKRRRPAEVASVS